MTLEVPEGVKAFNFWTLFIMARMWEEFPRVQFFHVNRNAVYVSGDHTAPGTQIGPEGAEQSGLFVNTLSWLLAEGFVDGLNRGTAFMNVRLTGKGFAVLNLTPDSISTKPEHDKASLGAMIREAAVKQTVDGAATLIRTMITLATNSAH